MNSQRYPEEFKTEAVRQILDHGHRVADMSSRLGVSTHSLYKWVRERQIPLATRTQQLSQSDELHLVLASVIEDASNELPGLARLALQRAHLHWIEIDLQIAWCDERIAAHVRTDPRATKAASLLGIGPTTASALVASVGEFGQFSNARQFGAWLGLVPSQNSTGGKTRLGNITKRGDDYLRTLLIQGAKSAVMSAAKRSDRISQWLVQLRERIGWQKTVVALANKNARILWAILTRDGTFDPDHVPQIPTARQKPMAA